MQIQLNTILENPLEMKKSWRNQINQHIPFLSIQTMIRTYQYLGIISKTVIVLNMEPAGACAEMSTK